MRCQEADIAVRSSRSRERQSAKGQIVLVFGSIAGLFSAICEMSLAVSYIVFNRVDKSTASFPNICVSWVANGNECRRLPRLELR